MLDVRCAKNSILNQKRQTRQKTKNSSSLVQGQIIVIQADSDDSQLDCHDRQNT